MDWKQNPEQALLLGCARTRVDGEVAEAIRSAAEKARWKEFVSLARLHGVSPLIFHNLSRFPAGCVPEPALSDLRGDFQSNASDAARLVMELAAVVRFLSDHGIECVAFKGPVLARCLYGEVWLRQFSDLDLLVRPADVLAAKQLLGEKGYEPSCRMSAQQDAVHIRRSPHAYAFTLLRGGGPMAIDLHWRVGEANHPTTPSQLNLPWSRLVKIAIGGQELNTFPPEDTLLLLCIHAAKHDWSRLKWICDIAESLRSNPAIDWDYVQTIASDTSAIAIRTLLAGVRLANLLLDAPLPGPVRSRAGSDEAVSRIVNETVAKLGSPDDGWPLWWPRSFQTDATFLRMAEGPASKTSYFLRFCAFRLVAPDAKDRARLPLPAKLSFLYYILRPPRLIAEYGFRPVWDFLKLLPKLFGRR